MSVFPLPVEMLRTLIRAIAVAAVLTTPVVAQTSDAPMDMGQIEQAYAKGDFVFVRQGLTTLAEAGDPVAQYRLGLVMTQGRGGPRDVAGAAEWLQKATEQGNADAATLLARLILSNASDPEQDKQAAGLFANAAARGNTEAQYYLGILHQSGRGVDQDDTAAFNWFLAASEGGFRDAQWELSQAYANAKGTAQNSALGLRWMDEAANAGHPAAQYFLGLAFEQGTAIAKNLSSAQDWYQRAAEGGHVLAQRTLGTIYLIGNEGQDPNPSEALRWLTAAAEAGEVGAMYNLGIGHSSGKVLERNDDLAREWLIAASNKKLGRATFALARIYELGRGVTPDMEKAVQLYVQSAGEGHKAAALRLGALTSDGALDRVVAPHVAVPWAMIDLRETANPAALDWLKVQADAGVRPAQAALGAWLIDQDGRAPEGAALLELAATAGDVESQFLLGSLFTTGNGVTLDYVSAHAWLNISAASGHEEATQTRDLIGDLMTPDQVAEAQTIARQFFEAARSRAPQTEQTQTTTSVGGDQ